MDHVSFYKLVETSEGTFEVFDFGIDVIQTIIIPNKRTLQQKVDNIGVGGPTLRDGNFIWTTSNTQEITATDAAGNEVTESQVIFATQMLSICSSE